MCRYAGQANIAKMTPLQQFDVVRTVRIRMRYVRLPVDSTNSAAICFGKRVINAIALSRDLPRGATA